MIDAATSLEDLRVPPANRLEKLKGDREGSGASGSTINGASAFTWHAGDAAAVEIIDYH